MTVNDGKESFLEDDDDDDDDERDRWERDEGEIEEVKEREWDERDGERDWGERFVKRREDDDERRVAIDGVENALGKQLGSNNALNNARATVVAVQQMRQFSEVARERGIPMEELWK